jgi:predicted RNA binding protein YcfA (HicA-like mRNA interferase family)
MKRRDLIRHLEANGCEFLREGSDHTVYVNRPAQKTSTIPRHRERSTTSSHERYVGTYRFLSPELPVGAQAHALAGSERAIQV